jgi:hypothetical protein
VTVSDWPAKSSTPDSNHLKWHLWLSNLTLSATTSCSEFQDWAVLQVFFSSSSWSCLRMFKNSVDTHISVTCFIMQPQLSLWVPFGAQCRHELSVQVSQNMGREILQDCHFNEQRFVKPQINIIAHILKKHCDEPRILQAILFCFNQTWRLLLMCSVSSSDFFVQFFCRHHTHHKQNLCCCCCFWDISNLPTLWWPHQPGTCCNPNWIHPNTGYFTQSSLFCPSSCWSFIHVAICKEEHCGHWLILSKHINLKTQLRIRVELSWLDQFRLC